MSGWIYTECPECGELLRVWVDFPSPTEGFNYKFLLELLITLHEITRLKF